MSTVYFLHWLHVIGASVLFGTGIGIAFFMVMAHRTRSPAIIAQTAGVVVIADYVFTATAVVLQPLTGVLLAQAVGWSLQQGWIVASTVLYVLTGALWLPVVYMQTRMRDLARRSQAEGSSLPPDYHRLFRLWFAFGIPAFVMVLTIFWLMIAKPPLAFLD